MQRMIARGLAHGLAALGVVVLLLSVATPALAHDNLGGDEMSMAIAIFVAGCVTIAGAALAGLWAWRTGQFSNVEEAKYAMLRTADNLDDLPVAPGAPPAPSREGGPHAHQ